MIEGRDFAENLAGTETGEQLVPAMPRADLHLAHHQDIDPAVGLVAGADLFAGCGAAHLSVIQQVLLLLGAQQLTEGGVGIDGRTGGIENGFVAFP